MRVRLPHVYSVNSKYNGNLVKHVSAPSIYVEAEKANYTTTRFSAHILVPGDHSESILLVKKKQHTAATYERTICIHDLNIPIEDGTDLSYFEWTKHPSKEEISDFGRTLAEISESWQGRFSFIAEDEARGVNGLREPQVGAIYAIKAHWSVSNEPATVVMPTGTGKTEVMISVLVSCCCEKVLIAVPTDALRTQIAEKFLTLGLLKEYGVIQPSCRNPIVGILNRRPKSVLDVDDLFTKCNVIITTTQVVGQIDESLQERIADHCSHLFIDEAHHVAADTWARFRSKFASKLIVQFTATPFREDEKQIDGKIVYKYPLDRAQEKGYFRKINFKPVRVFAPRKRDELIAERAVQQLKEDLLNYDHILMARVNTVERAKKVFSIYEKYSEFSPVQIHTGIKSKKERDKIRRKLLSGESRIVVCVDMLGEGFDLPQLKIAAFHDIKKSPTVTIQLAGRFTRTRPDLGEATFIANVGDEEVRSELKKLYTREPDWNALLPQLSEELIQEQLDLNEFAEGFRSFPKDIPIQSLKPALSTVIYKTKCTDWTPERFNLGLIGADSFERKVFDINHDNKTLVIITARKVQLKWTRVEEIHNWDWQLYVVYWDSSQNLLFINNSGNSGDFRKLAEAVAGNDVELIRGETLFKCFGELNRISFTNIGLSEHLGRMVSYTGRMGKDVEPALTELQKQRASKSVLVGTGYERGSHVSIGCSSKGRIWSHGRGYHLNKLVQWCSSVGKKILDPNIDPNQFLRNTLVSTFVTERPRVTPFGVNWNEEIYKASESSVSFIYEDETELRLYEVDLKLIEPSESGELRFEVVGGNKATQFELTLFQASSGPDLSVVHKSGDKMSVERGNVKVTSEEFFTVNPPTFWFVDGSELSGNKFTASLKGVEPFARDKIQIRDWKRLGVDIKKESQFIEKRRDSIQFALIEELKTQDFDFIFDDDSAGEAADIIAIKVNDADRVIQTQFYHCKYSTEDYAGARIGELYVVCGQSQKSIRWMEDAGELFRHFFRREEKRLDDYGVSRIEKGDIEILEEISEKSSVYRFELGITLVQPGLSKSGASLDQLRLLSVTESYLKETFLIPLEIIASE